MKFTKEEIETAENLYELWAKEKYTSPTFKSFLDSLLKPKKGKKVFEFEYDITEGYIVSSGTVQDILNVVKGSSNFKVTELPEVFSRKDMIELGDKIIHNIQCNHQFYPHSKFGNNGLEIFLSERKTKKYE